MESNDFFDPGEWEPTRQTLHAYLRVLSAVPRMWLAPHPNWWHITLAVRPAGLETNVVTTPNGTATQLRMDLQRHEIALLGVEQKLQVWDLRAGYTADELAGMIFRAYAELGVSGEYPEGTYENAGPREYAPETAARFDRAIRWIDRVLNRHRAQLSGRVGPVQLWPHGFDIAFECFGSKSVIYEANGGEKEAPAQINFGWAPGDASHPEPYFFSNPWPFDESLVEQPLPSGARWFQGGWKGTLLPYRDLVGDPEAERHLLDYWGEVFAVSHAALMNCEE